MWHLQRDLRLRPRGSGGDTPANPKPAGVQIRMSYIAPTRVGLRSNNPSVTRTDQAHAGRHRFSAVENAEIRQHINAARVFMGSQELMARTDSRTNKTPHSDLPVPVFSVRC